MGPLNPYLIAICAFCFGGALVGTIATGIQQRRIDWRKRRISELSAELASEKTDYDVLCVERDKYAEQATRWTPKRDIKGQFAER
jgi:hypothetical protein